MSGLSFWHGLWVCREAGRLTRHLDQQLGQLYELMNTIRNKGGEGEGGSQ